MSMYSPAFSPSFSNRERPGFRPKVRSDAAIEQEIYDRLTKENSAAFSADNIAIKVDYGQASLSGHAEKEWQRQWAVRIAARVKGVTGVRNEIVLDEEVCSEVLQALAEDERTTLYLISVTCKAGWVYLDGIMPTLEAAQAVEEVTARLPSVRGILSVPWVMGLPWLDSDDLEPVRRAFQPMIGANVFNGVNSNQREGDGIVTQIILDPCSRLLSHVAVRSREKKADQGLAEENNEGTRFPQEYLVPVSAIEAANRNSVWLKEGEEIHKYPAFHPAQYRLAPTDWKPPFPYQQGTVRLSR
ncbi:MAG: BON domain-containing protein [Gammaproteobacteria bacterium]